MAISQTLAKRLVSVQRWRYMSFKAVLKSIVVLGLLFIMLYVGMNNPQQIDFQFPIAGTTAKNPIHAAAAIIYFGMFAVGVLAGTLLHSGKSGKRSSSSKDK